MDEDLKAETRPFDVPLANVQIIWDYQGDKPDMPPLIVMGHPDGRGFDAVGRKDERDYFSSWGACNAEFERASDGYRLMMLLEKFLELVIADGLDPHVVHRAFCVIPEYRVHLMWKGVGHTIPDEFRNEEAEEAVIANSPLYHGRKD